MNDRYLYRAKHIHVLPCNEHLDGTWVIGYLSGEHYISNEDGDHLIDPETICQCTGLKDKHGKLIWENDIVSFQFDNDDCPFPNKDTKKRIGKVFFSDFRASWSIAMGKNGSKSLNNDLWKYVQNGNRVEVIGSAIDNPELLE